MKFRMTECEVVDLECSKCGSMVSYLTSREPQSKKWPDGFSHIVDVTTARLIPWRVWAAVHIFSRFDHGKYVCYNCCQKDSRGD